MNPTEQIGLNFIRPDVGRPGNHDFVHRGPWLVRQYAELGIRWNRLAFSWVLVQPDQNTFDWEPYDRILEESQREHLVTLATLGGHFDNPPVPKWAGDSLVQVVREHPEYLHRFIEAMVTRYRGSIKYWEMLNEPATFHSGLTVEDYVEGILKPGYHITKSVDSQAIVLPCAYNHLPVLGDREAFWAAAGDHCDIHNLHIYTDWGLFRTDTGAWREEKANREFRELMLRHGEDHKVFWVTETGWWGTAGHTSWHQYYKIDPASRRNPREILPHYTGREVLEHPVLLREDALRAEWMKDLFPRLLAVPGCEKVFLWVSLDEFEGGYEPDRLYGLKSEEAQVGSLAIWGIFAGDGSWRRSALVMQELLRQ